MRLLEVSMGPNVRAGCTLRGVDAAGYGDANIALHVGDDSDEVLKNRQRLAELIGADPAACQWLNQVHGSTVLHASSRTTSLAPDADAAWTTEAELPLIVMTADCVPVVFASTDAAVVAVAHAGWRGLQKGILAKLVAELPVTPNSLCAWVGPCISRARYEVGAEVHSALSAADPSVDGFFEPAPRPGHYQLDLAGLAQAQLRRAGVGQVSQSGLCAYDDPRCYSHRESPEGTGRTASFVMINP